MPFTRSFVVVLVVLGCAPLPSATPSAAPSPRGVVLVIGDGMGPGQVALLLRAHPEGALAQLMRTGTVGLVDPTPFDALVADSASGATALATGVRTRPRMLAVDPDGRRVETLLEFARTRRLATAVVTTADLTDATPAAFFAHTVDRSASADIAAQALAAPPTFAIGGGAHWLTHPPASVHAIAEGDLPYRTHGSRPTLAALTRQALDAVASTPRGFVLMVEAALIDNASHEHLAPELLGELLDLDEALAELLPRARAGELLLVVTADHETGGFGLQFVTSATPPAPVRLSAGARWSPGADFGSAATLEALRRGETPAAVTWATDGHTAALVPLAAAGPGAAAFTGFHEQWEIGRLLHAAVEGP